MTKLFQITLQQAQALTAYLQEQPYKDVYQLINALSSGTIIEPEAKEDKVKK